MTEENIALSIDNLNVSLSGKQIIENICMQVQSHQFVGILGPNGSGKSTLLKTVYKVLHPDSGDVNLFGEDVLAMRGKLLAQQLAAVTQFNELDFDFSVQQLVMMGRTPHKKFLEKDSKKDYEISAKALEAVGMGDFAERSYSTLSGGEKQRVILARAIAQQPSFLILDEPTNHLDIKYQLQILSVVRELHISVLAAMHDLSLAAACCDYIYLMKNGTIYKMGLPDEVLTQETISEVFEVKCQVYPSPVDGRLAISYLF